MSGTDTKVVLFNPGEGLTSDDLNNVVAGGTQRAWEYPGYGWLAGEAAFGGTSYGSLFASAGAHLRRVYTVAGGLELTTSSLSVSVGGGMVGVYAATVPPVVLTPAMRWIYIKDGDVSFTHAAAVISDRYDLVTVRIDENNTDSTSRDYKDGTTGALTTTTVSKRRSLQATFTKTAGVEGGGIPSLPAGEYLVYVARCRAGASSFSDDFDLRDFTFPWGPVYVDSLPPGACGIADSSDWNTTSSHGATLASTGTSKTAMFCPTFWGDSSARVIGMRIWYATLSGPTFQVGTTAGVDASTFVSIYDFSSSVVHDGTHNVIEIDFRGDPLVPGSQGPLWGGGIGRKMRMNRATGLPFNGVALKVISGTSTSIHAVQWLYMRS